MMRTAEMTSRDEFQNTIRIINNDDGFVYIEVQAKHDGQVICSALKFDRSELRYHIIASGVLS